jgi:hypothetical protein
VSTARIAGRARAGAIPCLEVADLRAACTAYATRLGFGDVELLGDPPEIALVRRGRATLLLQQAPGTGGRERRGGAAWDALVMVDDVAEVAADLRRRGTRILLGVGMSHVSGRTLAVPDGCGNVVAFAERSSGVRHAVRTAGGLVPARLRAAVRDRRLALEERAPRAAFQAFYDALPSTADAFYMFFTEGLLHWVVHAERLVPPTVNLVLLGSDLPAEERAWITANLRRPFHNVGLGIDDNTAWEFLFATNRSGFGWLDIDCFVLEPGLFAEMAAIEPSVALNGMWTYAMPGGQPVACSHFVFCNAGVIRRLREAGRWISPANYDWAGSNVALLHPRTNCRVPTRAQRRALLEILPPDGRGRPAPPGDGPFFDTLVAYQAVATASGYPTHPVRPLAHRTQATLGQGTPGVRVWQQDLSDEVVHVGGVSYHDRYFHAPELRGMYLAAEHALLERACERLPASYAHRRDARAEELAFMGIPPAGATDLVRRHLVRDRGLSPGAAARILGEEAASP